MQLSVSKLEEKEGKPVEVSGRIDVGKMEYRRDTVEFIEPIAVTGTAVYQEGVITLSVNIASTALQHCRRCLEPIETSINRREVIELRPDMEGDISSQGEVSIYNYGGEDPLEIDPYVTGLIQLDLEPYPLCKVDCKGLCPVCGANINEAEDHECEGEEQEGEAKDPRMEKLAELL